MPKVLADPAERRLIGARIRRVRLAVGLRQWQLAEIVGTSQPSICMYERGVLPDPLRLLRIARLGRTTVEWLLTGRHWAGGSEEMEMASEGHFALAARFHGVSAAAGRTELPGAVQRIERAAALVEAEAGAPPESAGLDAIARALRGMPREDRASLCAALAAREGILSAFVARGLRAMRASALLSPDPASVDAAGTGADPASPDETDRTNGVDHEDGPSHRLDRRLNLLRDILSDRRLRDDFQRSVSVMARKLEARRRVARRASES